MTKHLFSVVAALLACSASVTAMAQDETQVPEAPKTVPADQGFGAHQVSDHYRFPNAGQNIARVDRRDEIDASSDRLIVWPTAHTPHKGTLAISNHMLVMTQASYSFTDDLQVTGSLVVPFDSADTHGALSGKLTLSESENYTFSLQPFGAYRRGRQELANSDFGLGIAALADLVISNNLVVTLGAVGYATLIAGVSEYVYEECGSRQDFIDGNCRSTRTNTVGLPSGGHFLGAQVGLSWYILESLSLRFELMTGAAAGSVLGSEWLTRQVNAAEEARRFDNGDFETGLPYDTDVTLGGGLQWSNGMFALQASGYVLRAPTDNDWQEPRMWFLVPMVNAGLALF